MRESKLLDVIHSIVQKLKIVEKIWTASNIQNFFLHAGRSPISYF